MPFFCMSFTWYKLADSFPAAGENSKSIRWMTLWFSFILSYLCLFLFIWTLNLSIFPSDWRNLLWRLALVWHVALNTRNLIDINASRSVLFYLVPPVSLSRNGWAFAHYAREWRGSPEISWGGIWYQAMSLADPCSLCCTGRRGCYYCSTNWIWQVSDLLDPVTLYNAWHDSCSKPIEAAGYSVFPDAWSQPNQYNIHHSG